MRIPLINRHRAERLAVTFDAKGRKVSERYAGTAILASATIVGAKNIRRLSTQKEWQEQAWDFYDRIPELRYGANWAGNALSRARLYVGHVDPNGSSAPVPIGDTEADLQKPLDELFGGQIGQGEMLRRFAIQLNVAGETYLVGYDTIDRTDEDGAPDTFGRTRDERTFDLKDPAADGLTVTRHWQVASSAEISAAGVDSIRVQRPDVDEKVEIDLSDGSSATMIRMWNPHAKIAWFPDSALLSLRSTAQEILDLSAHISASARSRVAGAGMLFMPSEITFPEPDQPEGGVNAARSDLFQDMLLEAMETPLRDPEHPSALVPIVISGPAAVGKEIRWLSFSTELDKNASAMRTEAIRRLAVGMDLPAEILLGLAQANHWSAWAIEESALKLHVEPLLGLIASSLTTEFYRPAIVAMQKSGDYPSLNGIDPDDLAIWYDTTALSQRPNRAPEALQAREADLISDAAALREIGFSEEDAPSDEERRRRLIERVILTNPALAPQLLPFLGIDVPTPVTPEPAPAPDPVPVGAADRAPAVEDSTPNGPPALPTGDTAPDSPAVPAEMVVCTMAVLRALERAGQWLLYQGRGNQRGRFADVPTYEIHTRVPVLAHNVDTMLDGAYAEFRAALPDRPCLHEAVDSYVRALLQAGHPHEPRYLRAALFQGGCLNPPVPAPREVASAVA